MVWFSLRVGIGDVNSVLGQQRGKFMFRLMVGLGNPGATYRYTRHNLGSLAVETIADYYQASWRIDKQWSAETTKIAINGEEMVLMRPDVYMNNSGQVVGAWASYYQIKPDQIVILHDELDLASLEIRGKLGGGLNGHNGLRSVANALGNKQNFARIRFGIGRPLSGEQVADFVLGRLSGDELLEWKKQFSLLVTVLPEWLVSGGQSSLVIKSVRD